MTDPTAPASPQPAGNVLTVLFRRDAGNRRAESKALMLQGKTHSLADPDHTTRLLDRARARREKALTERDQGIAAGRRDLASRDICIVRTTADGRNVTTHVFPGIPRLGTLLARTGPDAFILSVKAQVSEK